MNTKTTTAAINIKKNISKWKKGKQHQHKIRKLQRQQS